MRDKPINTAACFAAHMGMWAIKSDVLTSAVAALQSGRDIRVEADYGGLAFEEPRRGVGVLRLEGPAMKLRSKFGGFSSNEAANVVNAMGESSDLHSIMLWIDSPGGQVAGGFQLADAIHNAAKRKRVHAHITNLGASLGYLIASQADRITIDESGMAGSIGVFGVLEDMTGRAEQLGIKVHLVSTGGVKGKGAPGTPVDDEVLAEAQKQVDHYGELFAAAISRGRGMTIEKARELMTGHLWTPAEAIERGAVDAVATMDEVLNALESGKTI